MIKFLLLLLRLPFFLPAILEAIFCMAHEQRLQLWCDFVAVEFVGHLAERVLADHFPAGKASVVDRPQTDSFGCESSGEDVLNRKELDPGGLQVELRNPPPGNDIPRTGRKLREGRFERRGVVARQGYGLGSSLQTVFDAA